MGAPTHAADITGQQGTSSQNNFQPTFTASAGQTAIIQLTWNDATTAAPAISDSGTNTWNVEATSLQQSNIGFNASSLISWANITTGGSPLTMTITWSGAVPFPTVTGAIFNGNGFALTKDKVGSQTTTNPTVIAAPSITTTNAQDVLFTSWFFDNVSVTDPTGWTGISPLSGSANFFHLAWKIVSATGTFAPAAGNSANATAQENIIALASAFSPVTGIPNSLMMAGCGT